LSIRFIDFHCHLDIYPNFPDLIAECEKRQIFTLAVTTTPRAWHRNYGLAKPTKYIQAALGLHPQIVSQFSHEVDILCELIPQARYIGEIGLDGSSEHSSSLDLQKSVLRKILRACIANGGRIMSFHSRGAAEEVLDILEEYKDAGIPILHWFSGTLKELDRAISLGCWFSVGPAMLNSRKGSEIAKKIPRDKILTETDGPFAKENGKVLMPWNVVSAIDKLSSLWGEDAIYTNQQILENAQYLLDYTI
jgi:TatD DNase family protein